MRKILISVIVIFTLIMGACSAKDELETYEDLNRQVQEAVENAINQGDSEQNAQGEETPRPEPVVGSNANFEYVIYGTVGVTLTKYIGGSAEVNIPAEIDGVPVTEIGNRAFQNNQNVISVIIPNTVTSIGKEAFYNCSITSITIPDSVTTIEQQAFQFCISLTSISIPDSVTSIGSQAFGNCTSLTSITIPDSITRIESFIFNDCTNLTSVIIPDSVTSIGKQAFGRCISLTSITIPNSVTSIEDSAFYYCTSLTSIIIPDSVTSIGNNVFVDCRNLSGIYFEGVPPKMGNNVFQSTASDLTVFHKAEATDWSNPWHGIPTATY